jgi:hypothetical protein
MNQLLHGVGFNDARQRSSRGLRGFEVGSFFISCPTALFASADHALEGWKIRHGSARICRLS